MKLKRFHLLVFALVIFALAAIAFNVAIATASAADWRWAGPKLKKQTVVYHCDTMQCINESYKKAKARYKKRVAAHDKRRLKEWKHCTGPEYSPARYTLPNSGGSGAYGKFQFMPGTYHANAKYHDWSALDQEIAARREFWKHGTQPWSACH